MTTAILTSAPGRFDFRLSATQEARASRLHRESIVFDMLSQHAGGNIFACYPKELQADLETRQATATAKGADLWTETSY